MVVSSYSAYFLRLRFAAQFRIAALFLERPASVEDFGPLQIFVQLQLLDHAVCKIRLTYVLRPPSPLFSAASSSLIACNLLCDEIDRGETHSALWISSSGTKQAHGRQGAQAD
jgi:hypothetical protein